MKLIRVLLLIGVLGAGSLLKAYAENEAPPAEPAGEAPAHVPGGEDFESHESEAETEEAPVRQKAKNVNRAKEAEGSKAPNRFEADVVSKSYYRVRGESLEVDPD